MTEESAPLDDVVEARRAACRLLVKEAQKASEGEDPERFDFLVGRLLEVQGDSEPGRGAGRHGAHDPWRILVAMVLIAGLLFAVFFAILQSNNEDVDGQTTAQYLSLVSGLAGIAIGWLYGNRSSGD